MDFTLLPPKHPARPLGLRPIDRTIYDTSAGSQLKAQKRARRIIIVKVAGSLLAAFTFMALACYLVK